MDCLRIRKDFVKVFNEKNCFGSKKHNNLII